MESKLWTWLLFLLAGVGVPAAGGAAFHDWALQHPLPALGILIGYELLVVVVGLAKDVWAKRRPALVEWLDLRVVWFFSRYYREYRQHLLDRDGYMDVKGAGIRGEYALKLEEVFVELSVLPRVPEQANPNPVAQPQGQEQAESPAPRLPETLPQGRNPIWVYLRDDSNLAILGAPGSGKTTLLYHVAQTLLQRKQRRAVNAPPRLPILLFLRDHWEAIAANPELSLPELTDALLKKQKHEAPQGWFEHQLRQGRCLVLLDGLDEVADPAARQRVVQWAEAQMQNSGQNRFVLTSRPFGYPRDRFGRVHVLAVQPFTGEQIEQFIHNWYLANAFRSGGNKLDASLKMGAERDAQELLRKLRDTPDLLELAVNPLLLTMIAIVHRYGDGLPGSRVDLYAKACGVFAGGRQESKEIPLELKPEQMQRVLQPLAFYLMRSGKLAISGAEAQQVIAELLVRVAPQMTVPYFLKLAENTSGLLLEQASEVYGFAHKTFQEYLAAVYIKEQGLAGELLGQVNDEGWHETIRLYVAQANDATAIIQACLAAQPPTPAALALALECMEERPAVDPTVRAQVTALLERGVEDADPARRRVVAEALLTRRLRRQMTWLGGHREVATSLITCAEYQLFLDDLCAQGKWPQPDHWLRERFPKGQGHAPVLGVRPSDAVAFCNWLTARERRGWRYQIPAAGEIQSAQRDQRLSAQMKHGAGYWNAGGIEYERDARAQRFITEEMLHKQLSEDLDRARALARASDLASALDRALARARAGARDLIEYATTWENAAQGLRQLIRLSGLLLAEVLLWEVEHPTSWQRKRGPLRWFGRATHQNEAALRQAADGYLDLYVDFVILEARIQETLQPFEGILLVRERQQG